MVKIETEDQSCVTQFLITRRFVVMVDAAQFMRGRIRCANKATPCPYDVLDFLDL